MAIASSIQSILERGSNAWPRLSLPAPLFVEHLAQRLSVEPGETVLEALQAIHAEDLYLACACAQGRTAAIKELAERLASQLPAMIGHLRLTQSAVDDVHQIVREKLLVGSAAVPPKIASYSGRGTLSSWLRVVTVRIALDQRRSRSEQVAETDLFREVPDLIAAQADPHLHYVKEHYRKQFQEALQFALQGLTREQRNLLRLHYIDGLNLDKLKGLFNVHRATVARWLAAARRELLLSVRQHLHQHAGLSSSEADSIARLVRSQIRLSMHRYLGEAAGPMRTAKASEIVPKPGE